MELAFQVKDLFFDRAEVQRRIGQARAGALRRQGAFVRTRARSSMRRRKKTSAAGQPPSVHSRAPDYLRQILYAYDERSDSVVVGPVLLNGRSGMMGGATVPSLHEHGGTVQIREYLAFGRTWWRMDYRLKAAKRAPKRTRTVKYPPRPFMVPALEREIAEGNLPAAWKDAIR